MDENIKKQLDDVCNIIDEKLEKSSKAIKDNVNNEIDTVVKGEVKNLVEKHSEIVERLDKIEVENKKDNFEGVYRTKSERFGDALNKSESYKAMKEGNRNNAGFEVKADVLISSDFSGATSERDATGVQRVDGIKRDPANKANMMQIIPVGSTDSNVVRFVKESAYTDNGGAVAEGSAPSDSEFELTAEDAVVQKMTAVMTISQEMLDDTPALSSYLSQRIPAKLNATIDDQLIGGSGTSPNLKGLLNGGTAFDTSASGAFLFASATSLSNCAISLFLVYFTVKNLMISSLILRFLSSS